MQIARRLSADDRRSVARPAHCRSRLSNKPGRGLIDGRSRLGRRVRDLADDFASQLGGWSTLSELLASNIRRAAELTALTERARSEALRDSNIDALALVRLEGAANRAVRALHLDRHRDPHRPSLAEYLAGLTDAPVDDAAMETTSAETLACEPPSGAVATSGERSAR